MPYFNYTLDKLNHGNGKKIHDISRLLHVRSQFREKKGDIVVCVCRDGYRRKFNVYVDPIM